MRVYPWIPITIFAAGKNCVQARIADRRNSDEFGDSSGIEASSSTTSTISNNYADEVSKYGCNEIQSTEIFDILASWCQQKKKFLHITDLVYVIHANPASSTTSKTSFSTAGRVIRDKCNYLRPNTN